MKTMKEIIAAISRTSMDQLLRYLFTVFIAAMLIAVMVRTVIVLINPTPQSAIDVFSTRFDECMATEKFTRDECVIYAKGE